MDVPLSQGKPDDKRSEQARRVLENFRIIYKSVQQHSRWVESQCGVSSPQVWALLEISKRPGLSVNDLADAMSLHQSTISNLLKGLSHKRLIRREPNPEDQRAKRIYMTAKGETLFKRAPEPAMSLLPDAINRLPEKALQALDNAIFEVVQNLNMKDMNAGGESLNQI
jgi:MarR family transcriptional regulator, organic hydroperoxide resistance regulator